MGVHSKIDAETWATPTIGNPLTVRLFDITIQAKKDPFRRSILLLVHIKSLLQKKSMPADQIEIIKIGITDPSTQLQLHTALFIFNQNNLASF